jgi:proteasome lid subunit RPN8/RPN11
MIIRIVHRDQQLAGGKLLPLHGSLAGAHPGAERQVWQAYKDLPRIECSQELLEQIRSALEIHAAIIEDLRRPSVPTEVSGFVFGKKEGGAVQIFAFRPIAAAYPTKPAPQLARDYTDAVEQALSQAGQDQKLRGLEIVGWYRSLGAIGLIDSDLDIYNQHCPQDWQFSMVFELLADGSTKIGFLYRDPDGSIRAAIEHPAIPPFLLPDMKSQHSPWKLAAGAAASRLTWKRAGLAFALGLVGMTLGFLFYELAIGIQ